MESHIAVFRGKEIRKTLFKNEWWFSIVDVVEVLTGSERPRRYWNDLKKKLLQEGYGELSEKIGQLKLPSADGKLYETDCANTETMFRIIQFIPSPKAEPFKKGQTIQWMDSGFRLRKWTCDIMSQVEDVVLTLIESRDPKQYIQRMKQHDPELGKGWVQIVHILSKEIRRVGANCHPPLGYQFSNYRLPGYNL